MKTVKTKNYGVAEILGTGSKPYYLKVKFKNTGNVDEFRKDAVEKGEIRDKYATSVVGVGIIGNIKTRGKYKTAYNVWKNMICRCYGNTNAAYYGKVLVCERWKTFEYFYQDMCKIDGWNQRDFETGKLVLDKDIKQRFSTNKMYSVENCTWTTKSVNANIQDGQQRKFMAVSPDGITYISTNISLFAREHNLERRSISSVLHGRFKSTFGWSFKYIDNIDNIDKEIV